MRHKAHAVTRSGIPATLTYRTAPRRVNHPGAGFYPQFGGAVGTRPLVTADRGFGLGTVTMPRSAVIVALVIAAGSILWRLWPERKVNMV